MSCIGPALLAAMPVTGRVSPHVISMGAGKKQLAPGTLQFCLLFQSCCTSRVSTVLFQFDGTHPPFLIRHFRKPNVTLTSPKNTDVWSNLPWGSVCRSHRPKATEGFRWLTLSVSLGLLLESFISSLTLGAQTTYCWTELTHLWDIQAFT